MKRSCHGITVIMQSEISEKSSGKKTVTYYLDNGTLILVYIHILVYQNLIVINYDYRIIPNRGAYPNIRAPPVL